MGEIQVESSCTDLNREKEKITDEVITALKETGISAKVESSNGSEEIIIYSLKKSSLSDYMPILQNFGFSLDSEFSYSLKIDQLEIFGRRYFISCCGNVKDLNSSRESVKDVLESVLEKKSRNTKLNSLSVSANLNPKEIGILQAIITYEDQLLAEQTVEAIEGALIKYPLIAKDFVLYFFTKFDPKIKKRETSLAKITEDICKKIKEVQDISDDKILNVFNDILEALVRTNFFVIENPFFEKALALKVDVRNLLIHLKGVQPRIETFVYHNDLVGTHLRRRSVSRGGLRWSDRELDYRDEIKSLM
ncbi:MAG: NAD-glutamate dehydrogenase, partial [Campylobacterales bacterium]|nr:NAD-glutamate dehydrogenase [Campylobacterales bacterium]